jgi:hypothetical protein
MELNGVADFIRRERASEPIFIRIKQNKIASFVPEPVVVHPLF